MDSLGKARRNALTTVSPPIPESKTPIGRVSPPLADRRVSLLLVGTDGDRRLLRRGRGLLQVQRRHLERRTRRQIRLYERESGIRRAIVHGRVERLDTLGNGGSELLTVWMGADAQAFRGIGQEAAFEQNSRHRDVAQNFEPSVPDAAIN